MNILEVRNLKKYYKLGDNLVKAVDDVSFSVEKGEFLAIIGPSGSGKSTLLHLIGGVDRKDSGEIIVGGEDITKLSNERLAIYRRREVGIIYQFYNLIATLNVEENISISKRLDDKTVEKEEMDEILRRMGLLNRRNNLPNQLSGGEMQRTSIARALINRPSLVLADEPTGNLDTKNSDEIINILREFNKNYKQTIILITHNPEIANQADRVIELVDGKIKSDVRK
ncbi:ABC transporter ATP-binding protein [Citroniella saccharovorans]|uniref:ABC transporter ATP-binding protein n=1 Tax=Citroniella saccharovorans TaxID=2053367 RepID=A0AAW9MNX7_9FIRM|nr:ABC transporter ATP-binding protein [Citroniella saccharovorans]MEB3428721.1 ABC transporter ATP-binding protein [Citroniella saccharovorans]